MISILFKNSMLVVIFIVCRLDVSTVHLFLQERYKYSYREPHTKPAHIQVHYNQINRRSCTQCACNCYVIQFGCLRFCNVCTCIGKVLQSTCKLTIKYW